MKKMILILIFLIACMVPGTIMGSSTEDKKAYDEGEFVAPSIKVTRFNEDMGMMLGIRAGWIAERNFTIDGCFYGLITEVSSPRRGSNLGVGYSGLSVEYTILPDKPVHILINTMIGMGLVSFIRNYDEPYNPDKDELHSIITVLEPGAGLEFNVTDYFRIMLGASYRLVDGVILKNLKNDDFGGITATLALRFGRF